jgi:hypothetical protein
MPRTIDGEPKRTNVSRPRPNPCGSDHHFRDAGARFRLPRQKPLAGSRESAVPQVAGRQQRSVDTSSSERWLYFATAVCFIAMIATFGMLIWQIARAFK